MKRSISILIFLFPLEVYQIMLFGFNIRIYDIVTILLFSFMLFKIHKKNIKYDISILSISLIIFFGLLSSLLYSDNFFLTLKSFAAYSIILLSAFIFINHFSNDYNNFIKIIILSSIITTIYVNFQFFSFVIYDYKVGVPFCNIIPCSDVVDDPSFGAYGYLGGLMRPTGFFTSMNRVGTYLIPACLLSLYLFINKNGIKYLFYFILFLESIIISLARNSILSLFIGFIIYAISIKFCTKNKIYLAKFFLLIAALLILIALNSDTEQLQHFNVFDIDRNSDISNSSNFYQHLIAASTINLNHFGLGQGFQLYDEFVYVSGLVETYGAHNNFLTVFGESGIYALFFYCLPLFYLLFLMIKSSFIEFPNKDVFIIFSVIYITLFISGMMRTYYLNAFSFLFFSYACYVFKMNTCKYYKIIN